MLACPSRHQQPVMQRCCTPRSRAHGGLLALRRAACQLRHEAPLPPPLQLHAAAALGAEKAVHRVETVALEGQRDIRAVGFRSAESQLRPWSNRCSTDWCVVLRACSMPCSMPTNTGRRSVCLAAHLLAMPLELAVEQHPLLVSVVPAHRHPQLLHNPWASRQGGVGWDREGGAWRGRQAVWSGHSARGCGHGDGHGARPRGGRKLVAPCWERCNGPSCAHHVTRCQPGATHRAGVGGRHFGGGTGCTAPSPLLGSVRHAARGSIASGGGRWASHRRLEQAGLSLWWALSREPLQRRLHHILRSALNRLGC